MQTQTRQLYFKSKNESKSQSTQVIVGKNKFLRENKIDFLSNVK
jgi:hypothetical protein